MEGIQSWFFRAPWLVLMGFDEMEKQMRKNLWTNFWTGQKRRGHSDFCTVLIGAYLSYRQLLVGVISSCLSDLRYFVCLPSKSFDALCSKARLLGESRPSVMPSLNANCLSLTYAVASLGWETFIGRDADGGRGEVQRDRTQSEYVFPRPHSP